MKNKALLYLTSVFSYNFDFGCYAPLQNPQLVSIILDTQTIKKLVIANLSYDGPPQILECSLILHMSILTLQLIHSVAGPSATVVYVKKTNIFNER